jgi:outer membrane receptor protein involved in Fe transport
VRAYKINRGLLKTTGIDTQLNYSTDLPQWLALGDGAADLTINLVWTHVNENSYQATPFSSIWDCAGRFGWPCLQVDVAGATFPRNRVTTSLSYASGDLTTYLSWRWIAPTDNAAPLNSAAWGYPDPDLAIPSVADRTYMDLGIGYRFSDNIAARLTIANLTGTAAPNMADAVIDKNTDTSMYDIYGRSYTLSFSLNY